MSKIVSGKVSRAFKVRETSARVSHKPFLGSTAQVKIQKGKEKPA